MYPSQCRTAFAVERSMLNVSSENVRIVILLLLDSSISCFALNSL